MLKRLKSKWTNKIALTSYKIKNINKTAATFLEWNKSIALHLIILRRLTKIKLKKTRMKKIRMRNNRT